MDWTKIEPKHAFMRLYEFFLDDLREDIKNNHKTEKYDSLTEAFQFMGMECFGVDVIDEIKRTVIDDTRLDDDYFEDAGRYNEWVIERNK